MAKRITKHILLLSLFVYCMSSCENNVEEPGMENKEEVCDPEISFSASIRPIISSNCVQCHDGNSHPLDFSNSTVVRANAQRIKELTRSRVMPLQGSLTSEEIAMIACWVDNGARDN